MKKTQKIKDSWNLIKKFSASLWIQKNIPNDVSGGYQWEMPCKQFAKTMIRAIIVIYLPKSINYWQSIYGIKLIPIITAKREEKKAFFWGQIGERKAKKKEKKFSVFFMDLRVRPGSGKSWIQFFWV